MRPPRQRWNPQGKERGKTEEVDRRVTKSLKLEPPSRPFNNVNGRQRAETELRQDDARNRAILETALDCIITIDAQGKVVEFNPAAERTFGYVRTDVIGRELAELIIPPCLREPHRQGLAHYLATGEGPVLGKRIEISAMHADGSQFPVELAITRIPTDGLPQFTAYVRDISERVRAEQLRSVRLLVSQHLALAQGIDEAAAGVLRAVCENLRW
ncbi:MAG: PAS domain S-box protein, partial [Arenimonas sp.]